MKLTKAKLIKSTREAVTKLGCREFKDSLTGADGLFIKCLEHGFYLMLGLERSRYYESSFTASYYLSKTTRWGSIWGDIPNESYESVGHFLTSEERKLYLDDEHSKEGVIDAWWNGNEQKEISKFISVVGITEKRFLEQENLFSNVEGSSEVKGLVNFARDVIRMIDSGRSDLPSFQFIPQTAIDDIPIEWFEAAETVIMNRGAVLNGNTVKLLAADAWRQKAVGHY